MLVKALFSKSFSPLVTTTHLLTSSSGDHTFVSAEELLTLELLFFV
jgi:hypothetical protein